MLNFLDFRVGRNWVIAAIVEWNGIFREFWFSGILGQPPDINQNFQHEFPETFCSIRFCTGISGNFGPMDRTHNLRGNFTVMVSFMSAVQINGENFKKISGQKRPNPKIIVFGRQSWIVRIWEVFSCTSRAANNCRSSDIGRPKFAHVRRNPKCGRTRCPDKFFYRKSFYSNEE